MWEWLEFHEQNQSRFNTWKLSIFIDVPWILFDNVNRVRFEIRPWKTVVNLAAEENRLRLPTIEAVEVPDWLDDFFSSSEAESASGTTLNNPWDRNTDRNNLPPKPHICTPLFNIIFVVHLCSCRIFFPCNKLNYAKTCLFFLSPVKERDNQRKKNNSPVIKMKEKKNERKKEKRNK